MHSVLGCGIGREAGIVPLDFRQLRPPAESDRHLPREAVLPRPRRKHAGALPQRVWQEREKFQCGPDNVGRGEGARLYRTPKTHYTAASGASTPRGGDISGQGRVGHACHRAGNGKGEDRVQGCVELDEISLGAIRSRHWTWAGEVQEGTVVCEVHESEV